MTDSKQLGEIFDLREQGYSIRDIADELGITKSSVERALKTDIAQFSGAVPEPAPATKQTIPSATNGELGILNIKLDHERQMRKLDLEAEIIRQQRQALEVREKEAENQRRLLELRATDTDRDEERLTAQLEKRKLVLVNKYNRIISELLENTRDATWHKDEVQDLLDRAESVQEKTLKLCNRHDIDEDELALWHGLTALIGYLEEMIDAANGRGIVSWHNDDAEDTIIGSWGVVDFDDVTDEQNDDEDEENEEEDEDEDEEDSKPVRKRKNKGLAGAEEEEEAKGGIGWVEAIGIGAAGLGVINLLSRK